MLEEPESDDGKVAVQFEAADVHDGEAVTRVPLGRLVPYIERGWPPGRRSLIVCEETPAFRSLARSQVRLSDRVLELGCSFGDTTTILAERSQTVVAVDVGRAVLSRAQERAPRARFELLDAIAHPSRLVALVRAVAPTAIFVDLGGDRVATDLVPLIALLHAENSSAALIVLKCRALHQAAAGHAHRLASSAPSRATARALPRARNFWARQLKLAALAPPSGAEAVSGDLCEEQNRHAPEGETRLCFDFTNKGRCWRRKCIFRHVLPEHPDAMADAASRDVATQDVRTLR